MRLTEFLSSFFAAISSTSNCRGGLFMLFTRLCIDFNLFTIPPLLLVESISPEVFCLYLIDFSLKPFSSLNFSNKTAEEEKTETARERVRGTVDGLRSQIVMLRPENIEAGTRITEKIR